MKKRRAHLFPFILVGLSLLVTRIGFAQRPAGNDSRNNPGEVRCRAPVTVTGAVRAPVRVELRRHARLNELLAFAGGLTERAKKTVEVTRATLGSNCERLAPENPNNVEVYNLTEVERGNKGANPYLQPGDAVNVSEAGVAYVTGSVLRPQPIILKEPTTVAQAIAVAGGAERDSLIDRVRIFRDCGPEMKIITVDLKAVKKGRVADVMVQAYDIVFVPDKSPYSARPLCHSIIHPTVEIPLRVIY